jgi:hypothetical protein
MLTINIASETGNFAENKDIAKRIREKQILPTLVDESKEITLDFASVTGATQSFIHALISEAIRKHGDDVFNRMYFKNCSAAVEQTINTVADYMEDAQG